MLDPGKVVQIRRIQHHHTVTAIYFLEKPSNIAILLTMSHFINDFWVSPDEETDGKMEDEIIDGGVQEKKIGPESGKSIVGMKRSMIIWVL